MDNVFILWQELQRFLGQGGTVLVVIMGVTFLLWMLILERQYYFFKLHGEVHKKIMLYWSERQDHQSWYAHKIRLRLLSIVRIKTEKNLSTIKLVVAVSPLLGLLGTVVGMIDVFDVMASTGASNARGMAAGVSKATIPTMAGMVVSLSGVLFSVRLQKKSKSSVDFLANHLLLEHNPAWQVGESGNLRRAVP